MEVPLIMMVNKVIMSYSTDYVWLFHAPSLSGVQFGCQRLPRVLGGGWGLGRTLLGLIINEWVAWNWILKPCCSPVCPEVIPTLNHIIVRLIYRTIYYCIIQVLVGAVHFIVNCGQVGCFFYLILNLFYFISVLRSLVEWVRVVKIMLRKLSPNFERGYLWGWGPFDRRQVFMTQPGA